MNLHIAKFILLPAAAALVAGCASSLPAPDDTTLEVAPRETTELQQGQAVIWGGQIMQAHKAGGTTCIDVRSKTLNRHGRPLAYGNDQGRFLACMPDSDEAARLRGGLDVVVSGTLTEVLAESVDPPGEHFPLMSADTVVIVRSDAPGSAVDTCLRTASDSQIWSPASGTYPSQGATTIAFLRNTCGENRRPGRRRE